MMVKRHLALFFLLLANVITFAHAIIPHHHHASLVCVVNSYCASDSEAHEHQQPHDDHKHKGENNHENCILKQLIALPNNQGRQSNGNWEYSADHIAIASCSANDNNSGLSSFNEDGIVISRLPYLSSTYSYFVICCLGLRAPPEV